MAKPKTAFVCGECGASSSKWQGQCGDCGAWNTLSEIVVSSSTTEGRRAGYAGQVSAAVVTRLDQVPQGVESRTEVGIGELDRVLGGGLVDGSVVLIGGDPGIGKSTLLLQALDAVAGRMQGLYVTGEESLAQVASRAGRLGLSLSGLHCLTETCVERIVAQLLREKPRLAVIDSIQTIYSEQLPAAPGSSVRCASRQLVWCDWRKSRASASFWLAM